MRKKTTEGTKEEIFLAYMREGEESGVEMPGVKIAAFVFGGAATVILYLLLLLA